MDNLNSSNNIKAIFFDLDGTLRHNKPSGLKVFREYAITLGAPNSNQSHRQAQRWAHAYWANSDDLLADIEDHGHDTSEFWTHYAYRHLMAMGTPYKKAREWSGDLHNHMVENYKSEDWIPPETHETLRALKEAGFILAVVTNRTNSITDYMQEKGLDANLDFFFTGGEIKSWKPEPEIFKYALEMAGVKADEALYVGDNYFADIVGAQGVGIPAVLIDPEGLFPEATVPVINGIEELAELILVAQSS